MYTLVAYKLIEVVAYAFFSGYAEALADRHRPTLLSIEVRSCLVSVWNAQPSHISNEFRR